MNIVGKFTPSDGKRENQQYTHILSHCCGRWGQHFSLASISFLSPIIQFTTETYCEMYQTPYLFCFTTSYQLSLTWSRNGFQWLHHYSLSSSTSKLHSILLCGFPCVCSETSFFNSSSCLHRISLLVHKPLPPPLLHWNDQVSLTTALIAQFCQVDY